MSRELYNEIMIQIKMGKSTSSIFRHMIRKLIPESTWAKNNAAKILESHPEILAAKGKWT